MEEDTRNFMEKVRERKGTTRRLKPKPPKPREAAESNSTTPAINHSVWRLSSDSLSKAEKNLELQEVSLI